MMHRCMNSFWWSCKLIIALGKGRTLDLFNDNIIEFKLVRKGNK